MLKKKKGRPWRQQEETDRCCRRPRPDNQNFMTAGPRGPMLLQEVWYLEKLAYSDLEVIPERRMHAKGSALSAPSL
jgi:catalase